MSWELHQRIRELSDAGEQDAALALIEASRPELAEIKSYVACLEANCHARKGDAARGLQILTEVVRGGTDNFWVYYAIAELYRNTGSLDQAIEANRIAHALQGWSESGKKGYIVTHDFFSPNIPNWSRWFAGLITQAPIRCLEIGSWQGTATLWLLDKVVAPRGGLVTTIDTFEGSSEHQPWLHTLGRRLEDFFDDNVARSGHAGLCRKLVGRSADVLLCLYDQTYDFVYVDGAHEAKFVIQDALLSWRILRPGGFLVFDDVDQRLPAPEQNTGTAINAFTTWFADELEIVECERQMLLRKR